MRARCTALRLSHAGFVKARQFATAPIAESLARLQNAWPGISDGADASYAVLPDPPARFAAALGEVIATITGYMADAAVELPPDLLRFYFDALHFARMAESFGSHSIFDLSRQSDPAASGSLPPDLCIRNVVPGHFLRQRYAASVTTILFSATLSPQHFYADTLGLDAKTAWLDVETSFDANQLSVHVVRHIPTRYGKRAASFAPIAELIATQHALQPGNYLAFFSSFDYMERTAEAFRLAHIDVPCWTQSRAGDAIARHAFLARFTSGGNGIGFAVLGGAFAEAIDLPGNLLIGAFIATLGLPQVNPVNEALRGRMQAAFGAGYDYAYLYPGLRKVVQAAGRVIRTASDRGSVFLIDARFDRPEVRRLLPRWWRLSDEPLPA